MKRFKLHYTDEEFKPNEPPANVALCGQVVDHTVTPLWAVDVDKTLASENTCGNCKRVFLSRHTNQ